MNVLHAEKKTKLMQRKALLFIDDQKRMNAAKDQFKHCTQSIHHEHICYQWVQSKHEEAVKLLGERLILRVEGGTSTLNQGIALQMFEYHVNCGDNLWEFTSEPYKNAGAFCQFKSQKEIVSRP
jgi:hypothetical protein